jgi:hypothetical protein
MFVDDIDNVDASKQLLDEIGRNHGVLIIRRLASAAAVSGCRLRRMSPRL